MAFLISRRLTQLILRNIASTGTLLNYLYTLATNETNGTVSNAQNYFALVDFSQGATTYPANATGFTNDAQAFYNYVQADATSTPNNTTGIGNPTDGGSTSYLAALQAADSIIDNDVAAATACAAQPTTATPTASCPSPGVQVASSYVIVFASDGSPISGITITTQGGNPPGPPVVAISYEGDPTLQDAEALILPEVETIMAHTANAKYVIGVNMFTIYYYVPGNVDLTGQALLAQMAKLGNGIAYSAVSGTQLNYAQFLPPSRMIKYSLSDVFVTNASTIWWSDGTLHPDTDMDGLPDDIETTLGSDPNVSDTIGNGISDSVEYRLSLSPPSSCSSTDALGFCMDLLTQCSSVSHHQVNGKRVYVSTDPDGLNDCEKILLSDVGGINNPDSNNDIIPDWLEFINNVPFQLGAASAAATQADGTSAYNKIKNSLPVNYPLNQLLNLQPANYNLIQVSTSSVQDCYNLTVTGLPYIGGQNTVRVDVVEKSVLSQDAYLYRVGKKQFPLGSLSVQFNDWNDATEKTLNTWKSWP
jgi:hypothetical protein